MKPSDNSGWYKPFENLRSLLDSKLVNLKKAVSKKAEPKPKQSIQSQNRVSTRSQTLSSEEETKLFLDAMADVTPISRHQCVDYEPEKRIAHYPDAESEYDVVIRLQNLIHHGEGFIVSQTPEYMEGRGRSVHPEMMRRLHRGDYAIQGHIDLHGCHVSEAEAVLNSFISGAIMTGKRAVLIIHGRGLSSPGIPVIKMLVYEWLTTGPWRKWVLAFSSARPCDGGAGATYVLLRRHPDRKQKTKPHRKNGWNQNGFS